MLIRNPATIGEFKVLTTPEHYCSTLDTRLFKGRETRLVNDLEKVTYNEQLKGAHRIFGLFNSILGENLRVLLKYFKCCITKQGLDPLTPGKELRGKVQLNVR